MHKTDWDFVFRMGLAFFILNNNNSSVLHLKMHLRICVSGFIWYVLLPLMAMYTRSETSTITFLGGCLEIYIYNKTLFYVHEYWYFLIPICIIYRKFNFQYPISEPGEDNTVYSFALSCWLDFLWMNGCKFAWFEFYAAGLHFDTQGISDFCRITKGFLLNLDCHWISYSGSCWYSIYTLECCYNLHPIFIIDNI